MPRPNATQADIGADVLITLIYHDLLNPRYMSKVLDVTGLSKEQLAQAKLRRAGAAWDSLRLTDDPTRTHNAADEPRYRRPQGRRKTEPPPANMKRGAATNRRKSRPSPDGNGEELWCPGTPGEDDGHFAHETAFLVRSDRPHTRVSMCDDHRRAYAKARVVKVAAREALNEAGIRFALDADSNLIGLECKTCGEAFKAGDELEGDAVLHHRGCHPTGSADESLPAYLPLSALVDYLTATRGELPILDMANVCGVTARTWHRWVDQLPLETADQIATHLGAHLSEIWPMTSGTANDD